ncbi:hypothetical protein [Fonticella tunisiensis]|uniref:Uncharacterized protein n=1 Tax=Fonticella tunisiensis TaxID=1096341 RepID=A0A4R7KUM8_9CLOT|nr:hypothetical protein [Fonticella tunisiensis]TDT63434.1 hypothetical protein EDD71_102196 [Fonticella tunisiensis]
MINEIVRLEDSFSMADINGNEYVVLRMDCTITKGRSCFMSFDILHEQGYQNNKDVCMQKMAEFKAVCEAKAKEMGVDII